MASDPALSPTGILSSRTRLFWLLACLCALVGLVHAATFDTPLTAATLDTANYKCYVDGVTAAMSGSSTDIVWTKDAAGPGTTTGSAVVRFGASNVTGTRHLMVGLTAATTVGTIITRGNVAVSVLNNGASYPPSLTNDSVWTAAQRIDASSVVATQTKGNTFDSTTSVAVWVLPSAISTRAIRFTHTSTQSDNNYAGQVGGVVVLAGRYSNLAPMGTVSSSYKEVKYWVDEGGGNGHWAVTTDTPERLNDLLDQGATGGPWSNGQNAAAISESNPEWVMMTLPATKALRGVALLDAGFGKAQIEYLPSSVTTHPSETNDSDWTPVTACTNVKDGASVLLRMNCYDFGGSITTRALRVRITGALPSTSAYYSYTNSGKTVWLGEMLALQDLSSNALSTSVVTATKTNPPIPISFTLASAGYVTLVINDSTGTRVRNLVAESYFPAGNNTVYWDGLDESTRTDESGYGEYIPQGKLVAPGSYTVKGLIRNAVTPVYEFTGCMTDSPPWICVNKLDVTGSAYNSEVYTKYGYGGWLADQGIATDIAFDPTNKIMGICGQPAEAGHSIIWTNLDGVKQFGLKNFDAGWGQQLWQTADCIAYDGLANIWYTLQGDGWGYGQIRVAKIPDRNNPDTATKLLYAGGYTPLKNDLGQDVQDSGTNSVGLTVRDNLLVMAIDRTTANTTDKLYFLDTSTGAVLNTINLDGVRGLELEPLSAGTYHLLAVVGSQINHYVLTKQSGMTLPTPTVIASGLDDPRDVTEDSAGNIYVACGGTTKAVRVYTSSGTFVRQIGGSGGNALGATIDRSKMDNVSGIAISKDAGNNERLWVAEGSMTIKNRVSVWTLTGTYVTDFFGPMQFGGGGSIDPDKTKMYFTYEGATLGDAFSLDWTNGLSSPAFAYSAALNVASLPDMYGRGNGPQTPINYSGRKYFTNSAISGYVTGVWLMGTDNIARPVAAVGYANVWPTVKDTAFSSRWPSGKNPNNNDSMIVAWSDTDHDYQVDPAETTFVSTTAYPFTIAQDLAVTGFSNTDNALYRLVPSSIDGNGVPLYDLANLATTASGLEPQSTYVIAHGVSTASNGWQVVNGGPIRGYQNGEYKWYWHNPWPAVDSSRNYSPVGPPPGLLEGAVRLLGFPVTPTSGGAGELVAYGGQCGQIYLFSTDGLLVATLFNDFRVNRWGSASATRGMDLSAVGEESSASFSSTIQQTTDGNIYLVTGTPQSSIVRIDGLTSVTRLNDIALTVTNQQQTDAANFQVTTEQERQQNGAGRKTYHIAELLTAPTIDGALEDWTGADWVNLHLAQGQSNWFQRGALAIANGKLYMGVEAWPYLDSYPKFLNNSGSDWTRLFRSGGTLELTLGTNTANPMRTTPQDGDLRLVVTLVNGTPQATLYRQVKTATPKNTVTYSNAVRSVTMDDVADVTGQLQCAVDYAYGSGAMAEFSIPLSALGLTATHANIHLGDLTFTRGIGVTTERYSWNSKAQGVLYDEPYEVQLYPTVLGRLQVGTNPAPTVALTYPPNNAVISGATSVTLKANATDSDGVSKVEFYACDINTGQWTKLGEDSTKPYSYAWTVSRGSFIIGARAIDALGAATLVTSTFNMGATGTGLLGQYYDNKDFTTLKVTRDDATVNFDWGAGSPDATVGADTFSVIWAGTIVPRYSDTYTFYTSSNDGSKLTVNGTVLWNTLSRTTTSAQWDQGTISLTAGTSYSIELRHAEDTGNASCALYWMSDHQPFEVVPQTQLTPTSTGSTPSCNLTAPTNGTTYQIPGATVTISATASNTDGVQKVEFVAGNEKVGEDTSSPYSYSWTPAAYGSYTIQAKAIGVKGMQTASSTVSVTIQEKPTVTLTGPSNNSKWGPAPTTVTLNAIADDTDGTVSKVEFYNGSTKLGEDSTSPYSYSWTSVALGSYTLTARSVDNNSNTTTSTAASISVIDTVGRGLARWYKSDAGVTLNGSTISSWADQSGNGYNAAQSTASMQPLLVNGILNGKPVLRFDGSDDYLGFTEDTNIRTIFWVVKEDSDATNNYRCLLGDANYYHFYRVTHGTIFDGGYASPFALNGYLRLNGDAVNGTTTAMPTSHAVIGLRTTGNVRADSFTKDRWVGDRVWDGELAELIIYDQPLTDDEMSGVLQYLKTKYALSYTDKPLVTLTTPEDGTYAASGSNLTLIATAADVDGTITKVEFYDNATKLGEDTSSPYSYTWTNIPWGAHSLTAKATDNSGNVVTSTAAEVCMSDGSIPSKNLFVWLKGDAGVTYDGSNKVSTWTDQSSQGRNAVQATTGNQPLYVANSLNGKPVLHFDGTDDWLGITTDGPDTNYTVITVFKTTDADGTFLDCVNPVDPGATSHDRGLGLKAGKVNHYLWTGSSIPTLDSARTYNDGMANIAMVSMSSTAGMKLYMNSVLEDSDGCTGSVGGEAGYVIGNHWNYGALNGDIAEMIIYKRGLSAAEKQMIESYLKTKYAINFPPSVSVTAPTAGQITQGANVTITATASDPDGSISKVEFYANSTKLGEDSTSPYSYTWSTVPWGTYNITAKAIDNQSLAVSSSPVEIYTTGGSISAQDLQYWLKADSIADYDGARVATWPEALGRTERDAVQGTSGYQPLFKTNILNGKPVVRFDGTDDWLGATVDIPSTNYTMFVTFKSADTDGSLLCPVNPVDPGATAHDRGIGLVDGKVKHYVWTGGGLPELVSTGTYNNSAAQVAAVRMSASTGMQLYLNGVLESTNTCTGSVSTEAGITIGNHWYQGVLNGDIAEIVIYKRNLSDTERAQVEQYLMDKYMAANTAPTVSLTAPTNNQTFASGSNVSLTANAVDSDGAMSRVEFYQGSTVLGTDSTSPYSYSWNSVTQGSYSLTAKAYDNRGAATTSTAVAITVNGNQLPTVTLTAPTDGSAVVAPATVTFTATASDSDGSISKVEFYQGTTKVGEDSSSPYSYDWTNVTAGTYSLTAKAIDNNSGTTTSTAAGLTVVDGNTYPVTDLTIHLRADAFTGLSDGATVSTWYDSSGNGYNATQGTSSYQPTYRTNIFGEMPAIRFDGSDDWMTIPVNLPETEYTFVTVFKTTDADGTIMGTVDQLVPWAGAHDRETGLLGGKYGHRFQDWDRPLSSANMNDGAKHVGIVTVGSGGAKVYVDGTQVASSTTTTAPLTYEAGLLLGTGYWGSLNGDVAEIMVYSKALTTMERVQLDAYLNRKYADMVAGNQLIWLKADAITGLSDGAGISTWYDSSGNSHNASQSTSTNQPTYRTNVLNGKPVVRFDGTDDWMTIPVNLPETNYSFVTVFNTTDTDGTIMGTVDQLVPWAGAHDRETGLLGGKYGHRFQDWDRPLSSANMNDGAKHVGIVTVGSGGAKVYVDGTQVASSTTTTAPLTYEAGLLLGTGYWGSLNGDVAEIIVYNTALTSTQCQTVTDHLQWKYSEVSNTVAAPTFSPAGGTYSSAQTVTISCATSGAIIRYTTNGSDPTSSSMLYSSPISVNFSNTVKARGFKSGMLVSATGSATYTISGSPLFTDNFVDGALDSHWQTYQGTWSESGGILQQTGNTGDRKAIVTGITVPDPVEITAKVRVDSWIDGSDYRRAGVALCTSTGNGGGYNLLFHNNHNTVQFLDDGVTWGPSYTFAWQTGVWYWFKLKYENGTLSGKIWADGDSEPSTYPYSWNRTGRTGYPSLNGGADSSSNTVSYDDVTVNTP